MMTLLDIYNKYRSSIDISPTNNIEIKELPDIYNTYSLKILASYYTNYYKIIKDGLKIPKNHYLINNERSYIGVIPDETMYNKSYYNNFSNYGSLANCLKIELLEDYFGKSIFDLDKHPLSTCDVMKLIEPRFINCLKAQKYYLYYIGGGIKKKLLIREVELFEYYPNNNYCIFKDTKTNKKVELIGGYNGWAIALDEDMLNKQLRAIKNDALTELSKKIVKTKNRIDYLNKEIDNKMKLLDDLEDKIVFEEERLNYILGIKNE